jgi:hypothetical protein
MELIIYAPVRSLSLILKALIHPLVQKTPNSAELQCLESAIFTSVCVYIVLFAQNNFNLSSYSQILDWSTPTHPSCLRANIAFSESPSQIFFSRFRLVLPEYSKLAIFYSLKYEQCYLIYDFNRLEAFRGQK